MISLKIFRLSLILSLSISTITFAGNPIRGFATDATSGEPLPVANVVIQGAYRGASTNLDGYFVIDNLTPGLYNLEITYLGYKPLTYQVVVTNELMEPIYIELQPEGFILEEVVIEIEVENEEEIRLSPQVSTIPISVTTIRQMPSLGAEKDVLRAIQIIPGVKASSDISSGIYVRGGSTDQTLILMDHNVVYNPTHLFGLFSTFNADAVKHIDLLKGGFPAQYGGRSGSVLEVITNEGNRKTTEGMVSIGIISARASLEGPLHSNKGSFAISGRRTYIDPVLAAIRKADESLDLPDYYFYDGNGKLNLDLTNKSTLTIAGYWGSDNLDIEFGPDQNRSLAYLTWGNRTFTTRYRQVLSRNMFFSVNAAVSRYRSKFGFENSGVQIAKMYDRLYDYSLKSDIEYYKSEKHRFKTGVSVNRYDFTLDIIYGGVTQVDVDETTYNYSFYAEDNWRITPLFEIRPGFRCYYHNMGEYFRADPRLAFLYNYGPRTRFKIAVGRYTQFINLIRYGEGASSFDTWVPVDETVAPSHSDQIVLGFEHEPRKNLEFTLETYYTDMNNIAEFNQMQTEESDEAKDAFIIGKGFAYGVELMLRQKTGRLTGWLGYCLSWTKRRFEDTYLNNGGWFYPIWDRRHDFVATANYALSKRWEISASWRYNTGQGFTQPLGILTNRYAGSPPEYSENSGRASVNGEMNNYRFPADHRLDISATYKHTFFKMPADLVISIYNVYSRRSYWRRFANYEENPVEIETAKLLPIIPMVSYEVRF
ncbi:MAG: TonB-dependent receptor [candidate division Zixibacteria bacterium]|nr:TonB-dependent receptor [Candidatus Tariuqbacter arcticus]